MTFRVNHGSNCRLTALASILHFNLNAGELEQLAEGLNREEERQMKRMIQRINTLVEYAEDRNVRVMVDAEQVFLMNFYVRQSVPVLRDCLFPSVGRDVE